MIVIEHDPDGFLVCRVAGKLTKGDYSAAIPTLEHALGLKSGTQGMMVKLEDFHGWEIDALGKEFAFDMKHRADIDKIAVLGQSALEKWGTYLSSPLFDAEIQFFDLEENDKARAWLTEDASGQF